MGQIIISYFSLYLRVSIWSLLGGDVVHDLLLHGAVQSAGELLGQLVRAVAGVLVQGLTGPAVLD